MTTNQLPTVTAIQAAAPAAASVDEPVADPTGQLLLLPAAPVLAESNEHARFRLSNDTREIGLRHVAEIRAQLAAAKAARDHADNVITLRRRDRQPAA